MTAASWQRVWGPGLAFQAVLIGGGYATGRELVTFFMSSGPLGGLLAMGVTALLFSVTLAVILEFSRRFRAYEYQRFFAEMIGPGWLLFEIAFIAMLIVVLSVVGAAAGEITRDALGTERIVGTAAMVVASGVLLFLGSRAVEKFLEQWSILLYACYLSFFVMFSWKFGPKMWEALRDHPLGPDIWKNGLVYAGVNMNCFVAILFMVPQLRNRGEAVTAGLLSGPLAMLPGMLFYATMIAFYPQISQETVPLNLLLARLDVPVFRLLFQIAILGTLLQTGVGLLHSVNERLAQACERRGRAFTPLARAAVSLCLILFSITLAEWIGLVNLIDKGYGMLAWVFVVLIFVPVFTVGIWKLLR